MSSSFDQAAQLRQAPQQRLDILGGWRGPEVFIPAAELKQEQAGQRR